MTTCGGLYFVYQCDFYYRREAYICVFARLNSWMNGNWELRKERYICLRPCVRLVRINFLVRQCSVSYRFLSISDSRVLGWDDESYEMMIVSLEEKSASKEWTIFWWYIMPVLREKDNCFVVNIIEEWYKWWNFDLCILWVWNWTKIYYRSLSKMGYEWNEKKRKSRIIIYCIDT